MQKLRIKILSENATIPTRHNPSDSGLDLYAAEDVIIEPGETAIVKTDIAIELEPGYEAQVRPRSGVTAKTKLRVQLGTVDADYRGNAGVIVDNIAVSQSKSAYYHALNGDMLGNTSTVPTYTYKIRKGDKIAQLVVVPIALPSVEIADELNEGTRGNKGFGSSGYKTEEGA